MSSLKMESGMIFFFFSTALASYGSEKIIRHGALKQEPDVRYEIARGPNDSQIFFNSLTRISEVKNAPELCHQPAEKIIFGALAPGQSVSATVGIYTPAVTGSATYQIGQVVVDSGSHFTITDDGCSNQTLYFGNPSTSCGVTGTYTPVDFSSDSIILHVPISFASDGGAYCNEIEDVVVKTYATSPNVRCANVVPGNSSLNLDNLSVTEVIPLVGIDADLVISSAFSADRSDHFLPPTSPSFIVNGATISVVNYFDQVNSVLYRGTGSVVEDAKPMHLPGGNLLVAGDGDDFYEFDPSGKQVATRSSLTGVSRRTMSYDSTNHLSSFQDSFGNQTVFNRDANGNLTSISSPRQQTTTVLVNSAGLVSQVTNPNNEAYSVTYKAGTSLVETFTKPGGQVASMTYDSMGRISKDAGSGGDFWSFSLNTSTFPAVLSKTSALNRTISVTNSLSGGALNRSIRTPSGSVVSGYDSSDGSRSSDNGMGESSSALAVADERFGVAAPRLSSEIHTINGISSTTSFNQSVTYNGAQPFGVSTLTKNIVRPSGTTTVVFDGPTRVRTTTSPMGATYKEEFDQYERVISTRVGNDIPISLTYDTLGRLSQVTQGSNQIGNFAYNSQGQIASTTNGRNETVNLGYDLAGRKTSITLPNSTQMLISYDPNGNMIGLTPAGRPLHVMNFNSMEVLSSYQAPTVGSVTPIELYTYNLDRQLTQVTRPNGDLLKQNFNATTGLLSSLQYGSKTDSYSYIANTDRVAAVVSADGIRTQYTYYGNEIASETEIKDSNSFQFGKITYTYDNQHRLSARTLYGNSTSPVSTINVIYDADDRPSQVGSMTLAYDVASGRLSGSTLDRIQDTTAYDAYGRIQTYSAVLTTSGQPDQILYTYTLSRDVMGRIVGKTENVQGTVAVWTYGFDSSGRLTTVTKDGSPYSSYVYDANGNRTSGSIGGIAFSATYDSQDRIIQGFGNTYTYNTNGELTQVSTAAGNIIYSYDALGRQTGYTRADGKVVNYFYDGKGNRVVHSFPFNTAYSARYLFDSLGRIAATITDAGVVQKEYVYATEQRIPDYMIQSNLRYRIIKDHLGSPRLVVKSTDGSLAQRLDYGEWGKILTNTSLNFQPFAFAGGQYDGLSSTTLKFGARMYDTTLGHWMSKDPILFEGGDPNLFGYVANDPINGIDPSGLYEVCTRPLNGFEGEHGPLFHQYLCANGVCGGQSPSGSAFGSPGKDSNDGAPGSTGVKCEEGPQENKSCMDKCIAVAIGGPRPRYSIINVGGTNCQKWANEIVAKCAAQCSGK